jgi:hypothetical protein
VFDREGVVVVDGIAGESALGRPAIVAARVAA